MATALHSDNSFGIYKKTFLICWYIHAPLYYPNYQIYFIVVYMPHYFLWVYSILMQIKTLFITLVTKSEGELRCPGRVSSSCSTYDTRHDTLVKLIVVWLIGISSDVYHFIKNPYCENKFLVRKMTNRYIFHTTNQITWKKYAYISVHIT
jgi:hypothetical protein